MSNESDRRAVLKKAAAAGAIAWVAPTVLSSEVSAAPVCTPKCLPTGTPVLQAAFTDVCREGRIKVYEVTVTLRVAPGTLTCPCGGAPQITIDPDGGNSFTISRPARFRGEVTETRNASITCFDNTNDPCETTGCVVNVSFTIVGNNGNDCEQNITVRESAQIVCP